MFAHNQQIIVDGRTNNWYVLGPSPFYLFKFFSNFCTLKFLEVKYIPTNKKLWIHDVDKRTVYRLFRTSRVICIVGLSYIYIRKTYIDQSPKPQIVQILILLKMRAFSVKMCAFSPNLHKMRAFS